MDEDEEEDLNYSKDRQSFEDKKNSFDIKRIMSEFIIKKEHFISYNKGDIKSSYQLSGELTVIFFFNLSLNICIDWFKI